MIRAVIFDCFGVLVSDSLKPLIEALPLAKRKEITAVLHASHHGLGTGEEFNQKVAGQLGMTLKEYLFYVQSGEVKNTLLMDYILELRQHYKTAILSNISGGGIAKRFTPDELARHFDVVVASGDVGYAKPEAEIYEIASERLGVRLDECVFIDDREEYCDGARSVGMHSVLYLDFEPLKTDLQQVLA